MAEHSAVSTYTMSEAVQREKELVRQAAAIVAASDGKVKIVDAMKLVGFATPERKNMRVYQQVRRRSTKLVVVEKGKKLPPVVVDLSSGNSAISGLSNVEERNASSSREASSLSTAVLVTPASWQE